MILIIGVSHIPLVSKEWWPSQEVSLHTSHGAFNLSITRSLDRQGRAHGEREGIRKFEYFFFFD